MKDSFTIHFSDITCIIAHPDDEVFSCLVMLPYITKIVCLTYVPNHRRFDTLRNLCDILGINLLIDYDTKPFQIQQSKTVEFLDKHIKLSEKSLLITHHPNDLHHDHKHVYECVQQHLRYNTYASYMFMPGVSHNWLKTEFNTVITSNHIRFDLLEKYNYIHNFEIMKNKLISILSFYGSLKGAPYGWPAYTNYTLLCT